MTRKLPPDDQVRAMWASGMTQKAIAKRYGVRPSSVHCACERAVGRGNKSALGHGFRAGTDPVEHRDTGEGFGGGPAKPSEWHAVEFLSCDDCRDLLREWGVPQP